NQRVYVFFADLDKFKSVNDNFGERKGDRVILEFASLLDEVIVPLGIPLHRSGDEFTVLLPTQDATLALTLPRSLMNYVTVYDFQTRSPEIEIQVGVSVGISTEDTKEIISQSYSYEDLEEFAEKAVKPGGGVKERGKARLQIKRADLVASSKSIKHLEL